MLEKIAVVGLGYVGLPLAMLLARKFEGVIGFDISSHRVESLRSGTDWTNEVDDKDLQASSLFITNDAANLNASTFIIVAVPTPIDALKRPDLSPLESACRLIAPHISNGDIIAFESTVYPGVTEGFSGALLDELTGMKHGQDYFLAYSPERINPGDKVHRLETIVKIVSAETPEALERSKAVYGAITDAGLHLAPSIKVAEAAKVIENAQRDINIAFMNEITQIFSRMNISIWDVLDAANTKWNFQPFTPGLVGGHCIGVDPYYLSYCAQELGYDPQVILSGRAINDSMGKWVAEQVHSHLGSKYSRILILGLTFKEDIPDLRNSRVVDVIKRLKWLGHTVSVHDSLANPVDAEREYGIKLEPEIRSASYNCVIAAVSHMEYRALDVSLLESIIEEGGILFDLKQIWPNLAHGELQLSGNRQYIGI
jgi:UDP-N-acetyl-D-glucosamine/UDP-N-acetyl-D-galactosamine dehydrogenase